MSRTVTVEIPKKIQNRLRKSLVAEEASPPNWLYSYGKEQNVSKYIEDRRGKSDRISFEVYINPKKMLAYRESPLTTVPTELETAIREERKGDTYRESHKLCIEFIDTDWSAIETISLESDYIREPR
jgi:hypothetical protein